MTCGLQEKAEIPDRHPVVEIQRMEQLQAGLGGRTVVERQRVFVLAELVPSIVAGVVFLDVSTVRKQNPAQIAGRRVAVYRAAKTVAVKYRNIAGMIEMRVCQDHRVERIDID
jgi:hypothetical protein